MTDSHASQTARQPHLADTEDDLEVDGESATLCGICRTSIATVDEQAEYRGEPIHGECRGEVRTDGGYRESTPAERLQERGDPHHCDICNTPFRTIEALVTHDCEPTEEEAATDGGQLPERFETFVRSEGPDRLRCRGCGDRIRRERLDDRLCPGCRYRPVTDGGTDSSTSVTVHSRKPECWKTEGVLGGGGASVSPLEAIECGRPANIKIVAGVADDTRYIGNTCEHNCNLQSKSGRTPQIHNWGETEAPPGQYRIPHQVVRHQPPLDTGHPPIVVRPTTRASQNPRELALPESSGPAGRALNGGDRDV